MATLEHDDPRMKNDERRTESLVAWQWDHERARMVKEHAPCNHAEVAFVVETGTPYC